MHKKSRSFNEDKKDSEEYQVTDSGMPEDYKYPGMDNMNGEDSEQGEMEQGKQDRDNSHGKSGDMVFSSRNMAKIGVKLNDLPICFESKLP